jgi:hypothetical protein
MNYVLLDIVAETQAARERAIQTFARQVMPAFAGR